MSVSATMEYVEVESRQVGTRPNATVGAQVTFANGTERFVNFILDLSSVVRQVEAGEVAILTPVVREVVSGGQSRNSVRMERNTLFCKALDDSQRQPVQIKVNIDQNRKMRRDTLREVLDRVASTNPDLVKCLRGHWDTNGALSVTAGLRSCSICGFQS